MYSTINIFIIINQSRNINRRPGSVPGPEGKLWEEQTEPIQLLTSSWDCTPGAPTSKLHSFRQLAELLSKWGSPKVWEACSHSAPLSPLLRVT